MFKQILLYTVPALIVGVSVYAIPNPSPEELIEKENRQAIMDCIDSLSGTSLDIQKGTIECSKTPFRSITGTGQLTPASEPPSISKFVPIQSYYIAPPPDDACDDWKSTPKRVILHYTATSYDTPVSSIANGHKARFGVNYFIAYHYLINKEGEIIITRPEKCASIAMKTDELNKEGIHIAYIGDGKPTEKQKQAIIKLTREIQDIYKMDRNAVDAHADFEAKNHKESMEGMFGSKEEFVKELRLQDKVTIYGKESAELTYMWHAWGDKDFIGTIFQESRMSNESVGDGGNSFGYCQIHKGFQPGWHSEYSKLQTMEERLNYCHEKYIYSSTLPGGVGSRFHGYNSRLKHIENIKIF